MEFLKHIFAIFCVGLFTITATAQSIANAEYFMDVDPGVGNGTTLTVNNNTGTLGQTFNIPTTGLTSGFHRVYVRVQDNDADWSHYDSVTYYINELDNTNTGGSNVVAAEYFFDNDPGVGSGTALSVTTNNPLQETFAIPTAGLGSGFHRVYIRVQDDLGSWSHYDSATFYVNSLDNTNTGGANITAAEYFFDNDPGVGSGTSLTVNADNPLQETFSIATTGLTSGFHRVYIRVQDDLGSWSHYDSATFYINTLDNTNTSGTAIVAAEYFIDTDPGIGLATSVSLGANGNPDEFIFDIDTSGFDCTQPVTFYVRVQDDNGTWSLYDFTDDLALGDDTGPTIVANTTFTLQLDANGNTSLEVEDVENGSTDDCSGIDTLLLGQTLFTCEDIGVNLIDYTVTDTLGNSSVVTITVTVEDNISPTLSTQNVTLTLDANGTATLNTSDAVLEVMDNCTTDVILTVNQIDFTCIDIGVNTVTITATDITGNSTNATAQVTVVDDMSPTITTQNVTVILDAGGMATVNPEDVVISSNDNCPDSIVLSLDQTSFSCDDLGENTVTVIATDGAANAANAQVQVNVVDNTDPIIVDCPSQNVQENVEEGTAFILPDYTGNLTVTDNCMVQNITQTPAVGTQLPVGTTTQPVTIEVTDDSGNTALCNFMVVITKELSVDNQDFEENLVLYPVPTTDVVFIKSDYNISKVIITDIKGSIVRIIEQNTINQIETQQLADGAYILRLFSDNKVVSKQIVKISR